VLVVLLLALGPELQEADGKKSFLPAFLADGDVAAILVIDVATKKTRQNLQEETSETPRVDNTEK